MSVSIIMSPSESSWPAWVQAIGSIVAIIVSVCIANRQVSIERRKADAVRQWREKAARAVTPFALSQICNWAAETMVTWRSVARYLSLNVSEEEFYSRNNMPDGLKFMDIPDGAIKDIQATIEAYSNENSKPYIALLQLIQVQKYNISMYLADLSAPDSYFTEEYCLRQIVDLAEIHARSILL